MENDMKNRIEDVIKRISSKYPKLIIGYKFDGECYFIWHNDEHLEYEDEEFRRYTGKLLYDYFIKDDFFNVYMTYDSDEALKAFNKSIVTDYGILMQYKDNGISNISLDVNQPDILESVLFNDDDQFKNFEIKAKAEINQKNNEFSSTFSKAA
jgi:uncharacterized UPF0160 family protein